MLKSLYHLFFPILCSGCHRPLFPDERLLCSSCRKRLNTIQDASPYNLAEKRLIGRVPFEHGAAFCYYSRDELFATLIKAAKYHGQPHINGELTHLFLPELDRCGWPYDVTCILPVPIHWRRRFTRGYNQAEPIARVLGEHWHLPVDTHNLYKRHYTASQVTRSHAERQANQQQHHPFSLRHPERLTGQHILLIDDVLTSGATLRACAQVLLQVPGLRISYLTLGVTRDHYR